MIDPPEVVTTAPQHYAALHLQIPLSAIVERMGPALGEIKAAIAAQGLKQSGPWFTHHFRRPTDSFDFEVCVPVAEAAEPAAPVVAKSWPAMRVARTVYHGHYSELAHSWGELESWIKGQGLATREDFWEVYLTGPEEPNPARWQTQLNWLLA